MSGQAGRGPRVVVTHPGRQHSHQAAIALLKEGMLAGYWAGVPALERQRGPLPEAIWRRFVRYAPLPIPEALVRWHPWTPTLRRVGDSVLPAALASWADFVACRRFDHWVARGLRRVPQVDAVIACEISALSTFREAKERGTKTILDAPSLHFAAQDALHGFRESAWLHERITRVKKAEIELADVIVTVSPLAAGTYVRAGVDPSRVRSVLLGADPSLFGGGGREAHPTEFTFLFAGAMIARKAFDLVLAAFRELRGEAPHARLVVVGPRGGLEHELGAAGDPGVSLLGQLEQSGLAAVMRGADCVVLPSRNDSFGMVVVESLASGVPVIVSDMVGAKELVEEGVNGWIVPGSDFEELARRMKWCVLNPHHVRSMRSHCLETAKRFRWEAYHERFCSLVRSVVPAMPV